MLVTELTWAAKCHFKYIFREFWLSTVLRLLRLLLHYFKCTQHLLCFFKSKISLSPHENMNLLLTKQYLFLLLCYCNYYWKALLEFPRPRKQLFRSTLQLRLQRASWSINNACLFGVPSPCIYIYFSRISDSKTVF